MNILKKYFKTLFKSVSQENGCQYQQMNTNTAKEKQSIFIKSYLKPVFKQYGYLTNGRTWWRDQGDFLIIINLQNFSWNTQNDVNFCLNIGIALKSQIKDLSKKPTHLDLTIPIREDSYLPDSRKETIYKNKTGYFIKQDTDLDNFINQAKIDFEQGIRLTLDGLKTIDDCLRFYGDVPFWGNRLKEIIKKNGN